MVKIILAALFLSSCGYELPDSCTAYATNLCGHLNDCKALPLLQSQPECVQNQLKSLSGIKATSTYCSAKDGAQRVMECAELKATQ